MSNVFQKALSLITGVDQSQLSLKMPKLRPLKAMSERELIQLESEIGREMFGPIPAGHRREFFNLDKNTWIWFEESTNDDGTVHSNTTRYEVQGNRILKAQDGAQYSYLEGQELQNLALSVQIYYEKVMRGIYKRDPKTGEKLPHHST